MITYLFGAGASAGAVPVVKDIAGSIEELTKWIQDHVSFNDSTNRNARKELPQIKRATTNTLNRLKQEITGSASIDTVAKRLYLQDIESYENYKRTIVFWFTWIHRMNKLDPRYELFLATILQNINDGLPKSNVNLLSWNYDMQLEMAYSKFLKNVLNINEAAKSLGISSRHFTTSSTQEEKPILFKINGSCCYATPETEKQFQYPASIFNGNSLADFLYEVWTNFNSPNKVDLSFAWEESTFKDKEFTHHLERLKTSKALVIIGYSFPTFNRKIDRQIMEVASGNNIKIYVQDMNPTAIEDKLIMNFDIKEDLIKKLDISNLGEFFIPPEYDLV